ncbi:MAG: TadE/TadG family type IV pilus assembly protein [Gemmataceae bacterium]
MLRKPVSKRRRGAVILESAVIYPLTFLIILGLLIGAMGVFRYQEVASLAREASRYASVHGSKYHQVTGKAAATAVDIHDSVIIPRAVALDPSKITYSVTWSPDNKPGSTVSVTVNYSWVPEAFLPILNLSSTATETMAY